MLRDVLFWVGDERDCDAVLDVLEEFDEFAEFALHVAFPVGEVAGVLGEDGELEEGFVAGEEGDWVEEVAPLAAGFVDVLDGAEGLPELLAHDTQGALFDGVGGVHRR